MFVMWNSESVGSERLAVSSWLSFGVRWQAQRDTALDSRITSAELTDPKRRRSRLVGTLPAHSKRGLAVLLLTAYCLLLTASCRRDMQDQPKSLAYRASRFYKDGMSSRPLVE